MDVKKHIKTNCHGQFDGNLMTVESIFSGLSQVWGKNDDLFLMFLYTHLHTVSST